MVTGALEFGFARGDDLVAIAELDEILVRATAEAGYADKKCQSQFTFDFGRAHAGLRDGGVGLYHREDGAVGGEGGCDGVGRPGRDGPTVFMSKIRSNKSDHQNQPQHKPGSGERIEAPRELIQAACFH